jgi:hypothetical protein
VGALCAGCCGSGMCWVCLGTGKLEIAPGVRTPCHKCEGSTECHVCGGEADGQPRAFGAGRSGGISRASLAG